MKAFAVEATAPIYLIQDRGVFQVKESLLLPPPSTVIGILARGIGLTLGFTGEELQGEEKRGRGQEVLVPNFKLLREAVHKASWFITVKPMGSIARSSVIHRVVRFEQKKWTDAMLYRPISAKEFKMYYALDLSKLNEELSKLGREIKETDVLLALYTLERVGLSEDFASPLNVYMCKTQVLEERTVCVDTYVSMDLAEPISGKFYWKGMYSGPDEKLEYYILPIDTERGVPSRVKVKVKDGAVGVRIDREATTVASKH